MSETMTMDERRNTAVQRARDVIIRATPLGLATNQSNGDFIPFRWLIDLNAKTMRILASDDPEVLLLMASIGHGKTTYMARWLVVWYMATFPERSVILGTHTQEFANEAGDFIGKQLAIAAPSYGWAFDRGQPSARAHFKTPMGGQFYALGRGSAVAGRHVDLIVIDDPYANAKEAMSPTIRAEAWRWLTSDIKTRLRKNGKFVLTHARWHSDDAIGQDDQTKDRPAISYFELSGDM